MTTLLHILIALALLQGLVSLRDGWHNMHYALGYEPGLSTPGSVVVFCPVKGRESQLESNLRSLMAQTHPNYRIVFIVESHDEPALEVLRHIPGAEVVVAGPASAQGQKVHNLIEGIRSLTTSPDIFAFVDADARVPPSWLSDLVGPLSDPAVGASSGYRWYVPPQSSFPSLLRSAWNASVAGFLGPHGQNFAWGGSTAIRRETFEQIDVIGRWEGTVSDDYQLTAAVQAAGLGLVFVPLCLVPSYGSCTWPNLIEFTTRQIQVTRVYAPRIWLVGITSYTLFNLTFWWLGLRMIGQAAYIGPWITIYLLSILRADLRQRGVGRTIRDPSLDAHRWFYRLSAPLVALLYQFNFLISLFSRRINWKGVHYKLISANETLIENR